MSETTPSGSELVTVCLADVKPASPESLRAHESAYRRGYTQGYCAALDDRERYSAARCNNHLDLLMEWRAHHDVPAMTCPPDLGAKKIKIGGAA